MGGTYTRKTFDLVLSAWSPAVETADDLLGIEAYSWAWCVCVAPLKVRYDPIQDKILRAFRVPCRPWPNADDLRLTLADMGRTYAYDSLRETMHAKKSATDLVGDVLQKLASLGREVDRGLVIRMVESLWPAGDEADHILECVTEVDSGVLMWRVDRKR
jgi:hypothetical protein